MKDIIIETISPSGSWSTNFTGSLDKAYIEYMKVCDIIPGKKLNNKFVIMPSHKSNNTLLCLYFVDKADSLNPEEFCSNLEKYLKDPRKYDANLKLAHLRSLHDEDEVTEDALTNEEALSIEDQQENQQVYEETGYEISGRSPRKSSVTSTGQNPKYITRGSFSTVVNSDTTDLEVEKKLVYLMNNEYFSNFKALENLKDHNLVLFETPNAKVAGSNKINEEIAKCLESSNIKYSFTSEL